MAKFIAEMSMYHVDEGESTKMAEEKAKVTASAPEFFARIVAEKLAENRHAEDFSKLKPPTKITLHFSISESTGGTETTIKPEEMTLKEVEDEVLGRLESFINLLSGESTYDSSHGLP